jgi:predicted transcriptional regulator
MPTRDQTSDVQDLVRTSILVSAETDAALRALADEGKRPLSWEIRTALEDWVERNNERLKASA